MLAALFLSVFLAAEAPQGDPSFHLVVEVEDEDGSHVQRAYHAFPTLEEAFVEVTRLHRSGVCFTLADPPIPDPDLVALCYPPARILRTRVLFY